MTDHSKHASRPYQDDRRRIPAPLSAPPPPPLPAGYDPGVSFMIETHELESTPAGYFPASQVRWSKANEAMIFTDWHDCKAVQIIEGFVIIYRPEDPNIIVPAHRFATMEFE